MPVLDDETFFWSSKHFFKPGLFYPKNGNLSGFLIGKKGAFGVR